MKERLYWEFRRSTDLHYEWSTIHIFVGRSMAIREMMRGSTGSVQEKYEALLNKGYEFHIDRAYTWVTFKWQHYNNSYPREYCEADVAVGGHYNDIKRNIKLMDKVVRKVMKMQGRTFVGYSLLTPKTVIAALKKLRAKHVEQDDYSYYRRVA